ncbi:serine/threonine protein kinase [Kitasatospora sp. MAP12-15]|uniref:serine/threonine protein kinase n=1 Tax=unclassified Kitasatospora TaxID=2633591 RepID=UPI002474B2F0|nr:serine/threonine-protein kinase [Kitasatospora sp. MAP12-44]MDH6114355.1 serine/threonine protein kinase [Kitasatospora sp. MAP12-44]
MSTPRDLSPASPIGPYLPLHQIGAGGMGTVYFAYHPATGDPMAVKVLHADHAQDRAWRARFAREVTVLQKVRGPYLVPLLDADTQAETPWLAMPYVAGNTLRTYVTDHGPLQAENLTTFAAAVADALSCIHAADVAHRDLKPDNVILAADGPRVVDFGIAHHLDATAVTTTSLNTGTPAWMAPEQFTQGTTTPACDVFAWGLLVAYAAGGRHPFGAPTGIEYRIVSAKPDLVAVPPRLRRFVEAALAKDPAARPSAGHLCEQTAALFGPQGTLVFPTVAFTRVTDRQALTVPLQRSHWDIPPPLLDLTLTIPRETQTPGRAASAGPTSMPPPLHREQRDQDTDSLTGPAAQDLLDRCRMTAEQGYQLIRQAERLGLNVQFARAAVDEVLGKLTVAEAAFAAGHDVDGFDLARSVEHAAAALQHLSIALPPAQPHPGGTRSRRPDRVLQGFLWSLPVCGLAFSVIAAVTNGTASHADSAPPPAATATTTPPAPATTPPAPLLTNQALGAAAPPTPPASAPSPTTTTATASPTPPPGYVTAPPTDTQNPASPGYDGQQAYQGMNCIPDETDTQSCFPMVMNSDSRTHTYYVTATCYWYNQLKPGLPWESCGTWHWTYTLAPNAEQPQTRTTVSSDYGVSSWQDISVRWT